jgi:tetratricopeptide (TPR) repeat protein
MYGELLLTMNRYDEANIIYERAYKIDKDVAENIANYYESINGYEEWARYWRNKSK